MVTKAVPLTVARGLLTGRVLFGDTDSSSTMPSVSSKTSIYPRHTGLMGGKGYHNAHIENIRKLDYMVV